MEYLDLVQWPATIASLVAAWLVASQAKSRRAWGFAVFILSNVLWIIWGWHDAAYALIALQVGLFLLNLRGFKKNDPESSQGSNHVSSGKRATGMTNLGTQT